MNAWRDTEVSVTSWTTKYWHKLDYYDNHPR